MKGLPSLGLLALCLVWGLQASSAGQTQQAQPTPPTEQTENPRKIAIRINPPYPALARTMNLTGKVRLQAVVLGNGKVKSLEVLGGNPVLVQSAQTAVRGWRWEKLDRETTELVEVNFMP